MDGTPKICALAAEIRCDAGHDASIIVRAMPRCGGLSIKTFEELQGHPRQT